MPEQATQQKNAGASPDVQFAAEATPKMNVGKNTQHTHTQIKANAPIAAKITMQVMQDVTTSK